MALPIKALPFPGSLFGIRLHRSFSSGALQQQPWPWTRAPLHWPWRQWPAPGCLKAQVRFGPGKVVVAQQQISHAPLVGCRGPQRIARNPEASLRFLLLLQRSSYRRRTLCPSITIQSDCARVVGSTTVPPLQLPVPPLQLPVPLTRGLTTYPTHIPHPHTTPNSLPCLVSRRPASITRCCFPTLPLHSSTACPFCLSTSVLPMPSWPLSPSLFVGAIHPPHRNNSAHELLRDWRRMFPGAMGIQSKLVVLGAAASAMTAWGLRGTNDRAAAAFGAAMAANTGIFVYTMTQIMPLNRRLLPEGEVEKEESEAGILGMLKQVGGVARRWCPQGWVAGWLGGWLVPLGGGWWLVGGQACLKKAAAQAAVTVVHDFCLSKVMQATRMVCAVQCEWRLGWQCL